MHEHTSSQLSLSRPFRPCFECLGSCSVPGAIARLKPGQNPSSGRRVACEAEGNPQGASVIQAVSAHLVKRFCSQFSPCGLRATRRMTPRRSGAAAQRRSQSNRRWRHMAGHGSQGHVVVSMLRRQEMLEWSDCFHAVLLVHWPSGLPQSVWPMLVS